MKKRISMLGVLVLLLAACGIGNAYAEQPEASGQEAVGKSPEILAVYSCPATQIITSDDRTKELADTVIFLYQDLSYVQYVNHNNRYEVYSGGTFELNFDWTEPGWEEQTPHILTLNVRQIHGADHALKFIDAVYDINLDKMTDYCLYPDNVRTDLKLVAAFMQVDKQKLVRQDGSEEYLPMMPGSACQRESGCLCVRLYDPRQREHRTPRCL